MYCTTVDRYATDSRPIFQRQLTDIPPTTDTPRIGRVSTGVLTGRYIGRLSADMSIDMSTDMAIENRSILG